MSRKPQLSITDLFLGKRKPTKTAGSSSKSKKRRKVDRSKQVAKACGKIPSHIKVTAYSNPSLEALFDRNGVTAKGRNRLISTAFNTNPARTPNPVEGWLLNDDDEFLGKLYSLLMPHILFDKDDTTHSLDLSWRFSVEERFLNDFSRLQQPEFSVWSHCLWKLFRKEESKVTDDEALELASDILIDHLKACIGELDGEDFVEGGFLKPLSTEVAYGRSKKSTNSGHISGADETFVSRWGYQTEPVWSAVSAGNKLLTDHEYQDAAFESNTIWMLFSRVKDTSLEEPTEARPVICPPLIDKLAGKRVTDPVVRLFQRMAEEGLDTTFAGFCGGERVQLFMESDSVTDMDHWAELDWKSFDVNCRGVLPYAVKVLKGLYPEEYHRYIQKDFEWSQNINVATPAGMVTGKFPALPSGWSKTSIYGTLCSYITILALMARDVIPKGSKAYCFGDDVMLMSNDEIDIDSIGEFSRENYGMIVKTEKCDQSSRCESASGDVRHAAFLGYYHDPRSVANGERGYFPAFRMAPKFKYMEKYKSFKSDRGRCLDMLMRLDTLSGRDHESYIDLCRFVVENCSFIRLDTMPRGRYTMSAEEFDKMRENRISRKLLEQELGSTPGWQGVMRVFKQMLDETGECPGLDKVREQDAAEATDDENEIMEELDDLD